MFKKLISCFAALALLLAPTTPVQANIFTNVFGGSPVSPSDVAYASYTFGSNLQMVWPQFTAGSPNVTARFMNMTATASGLNVTMPDATLASAGYDTIIFNAGSNSFNVVGFTGGAIVTIAPGQSFYLMLNNNSTQQGGWQTVQFGAGTSSANASALAGAGLQAVAGLLNVNLTANNVSNSFTATQASQSLMYVWTGGSGTITLPTASSVGNGFFFMLANNGTGSVTVSPTGGNTIDGNSSSVFTQTQSGFIMSNGANWFTLGKGIQNTFAVTLLNLNVAGSSNVTETSAQAQNIIQTYTGALTGNINVIVPATVQLYFVNNATSGAFTLTVKTPAGSGILVPQGSNAILYCDGTNVVNAFTAAVSGTLALVAGSAPSPSLSFQGSPSTGIFSAAVNTVSLAANGFEALRVLSAASSVNTLTVSASATGNPVQIGTIGTDATIPITLAPKGGAAVNLSNAVITGGTVDNAVIGGSTPVNITGAIITANTRFSGPLTGNVTGTVTGHSTLDLAVANNLSDVNNAATSLSNLGGAPLASPALTGTPTAPTAVGGTNTTQIATTAFVANSFAPLASPALTGTPTAPTQTTLDATTAIATDAFVQKGAAQAYVMFDSNGTIISNFNVSSVSRTSTGVFNITFGTAFADANYIPQCTAGSNSGSSSTIVANPITETTTQLTIQTNVSTSGSSTNPTRTWCTVFGQ